MTHAAPGQASHVSWLLSPWDHRMLAFRDGNIGDVVAEATCQHRALTRRLSDKDGCKWGQR